MSKQEGLTWSILNSDDSRGDYRSIEKQTSPLMQSSNKLEDLISMDKKVAKGKRKMKSNDKNGMEESSDHEIHIYTERERRKKMRDMFSKLHLLLPQLPPKADKSTIVDEAITSIKSHEQTLQKLQNQKLEKLQHSSSSNTTPTFTYAPSSSSSPTNHLIPISNLPQILPIDTTLEDSYSRETFLADRYLQFVLS